MCDIVIALVQSYYFQAIKWCDIDVIFKRKEEITLNSNIWLCYTGWLDAMRVAFNDTEKLVLSTALGYLKGWCSLQQCCTSEKKDNSHPSRHIDVERVGGPLSVNHELINCLSSCLNQITARCYIVIYMSESINILSTYYKCIVLQLYLFELNICFFKAIAL